MGLKFIFLVFSVFSLNLEGLNGHPVESEMYREGRQGILDYPKQLAAILSGVISESLDRVSNTKVATKPPTKMVADAVAAILPPRAVTSPPAAQVPLPSGPIVIEGNSPGETFNGESLFSNYLNEVQKVTTLTPINNNPVFPPANSAVTEPPKKAVAAVTLAPIIPVDEDISLLGIGTSKPKRVSANGVSLESIAFPGGLQSQQNREPPPPKVEEDDEASTTLEAVSTDDDEASTTAGTEETESSTAEDEEVDENEEINLQGPEGFRQY